MGTVSVTELQVKKLNNLINRLDLSKDQMHEDDIKIYVKIQPHFEQEKT